MSTTRCLLMILLVLCMSCISVKEVEGALWLAVHGETEEKISDLPDGEHTIHYSKSHPDERWRGRKWGEGEVKNGRREGRWVFYFPNGFPKKKTTYDRGFINGMTTYYYNRGWLRSRGMQLRSQRVGEWESWEWGEASDVR
ncbi:MAG: hypothetical protein ISQ11_02460 [Planctomycetes bacterium]|nr:hypothetical protein [Planctomycetota bacterium]